MAIADNPDRETVKAGPVHCGTSIFTQSTLTRLSVFAGRYPSVRVVRNNIEKLSTGTRSAVSLGNATQSFATAFFGYESR